MKRTIIFFVLLIAFASAAYVLLGFGRIPPSEDVPEVLMPVCLNDSLSNKISDYQELDGMDLKVRRYMDQWQLKGTSLAIMRNDSLLYAKGYGLADDDVQMEPSNIMRMASVSKLVTAVGIMTLQDRGMLSIKDKVFGPEGILKDSLLNSFINDTTYYQITVEHLLRHQGGFYRDPAFSSKDVKNQLLLDRPPVFEDYARVVLGHRLRFAPGTSQSYSNLGYMILSRIVEEVTGQSYEQWMQEEVLEPAGCMEFHIANNYYSEKFPREVRYYTHDGDGKYLEDYHGNGKTVERSYGGNDINILSGAGAWVASVPELMKLVASIDGKPEVPDIISPGAVRQMTEYIDTSVYSLGWNDTKPTGEWSRTGSFSGTTALVKYFPDGECWIIINNTSTWKGPYFSRYTENLMNECRERYSALLPSRNLFYR